ncbi:GNAT family N-acetyltransferase [Deefgea tanakiae]|jgi:N-acetylglutamate synthase-like GNAT family acetyltransferase|uniref:GNAT family N-acetyltransferase n=1 Tax=Deefgea tanakiae TaxID=2865840 RepID=A0ABX8Z996_9NEIS|nr:GNAT family N-acetyltransferase [Deefgea tanakiae]QZA79138.1 GNAT family N-acetyltransferase [Deefgea tanakiae]
MMKKTLTFRPANAEDAEAIAELIRQSITELCDLDHQHNEAELADWLTDINTEAITDCTENSSVQYLALLGKKRVGFASMNWQGEIVHLYVAPKQTQNGIATALLAALELAAREHGFNPIMVATTHSARGFFRTRGFIPTRPDYAEWLEKPLQQH